MTEVLTFKGGGLPDLKINKIYQFQCVPYRNIQQNTAPSGRLFSQKSYQKRSVIVKFGWLEPEEKMEIVKRIVDTEFELLFFNEETQEFEQSKFLLANGRYEPGTMKDVSHGRVWIDFGFTAVETRGY
jgi:hypothetical protein